MESLSCKTPTNCRTCEHFEAGVGCALELDLELALHALTTRERPPLRIPLHGRAPGSPLPARA